MAFVKRWIPIICQRRESRHKQNYLQSSVTRRQPIAAAIVFCLCLLSRLVAQIIQCLASEDFPISCKFVFIT